MVTDSAESTEDLSLRLPLRTLKTLCAIVKRKASRCEVLLLRFLVLKRRSKGLTFSRTLLKVLHSQLTNRAFRRLLRDCLSGSQPAGPPIPIASEAKKRWTYDD